jgi:hypothetical protein
LGTDQEQMKVLKKTNEIYNIKKKRSHHLNRLNHRFFRFSAGSPVLYWVFCIGDFVVKTDWTGIRFTAESVDSADSV